MVFLYFLSSGNAIIITIIKFRYLTKIFGHDSYTREDTNSILCSRYIDIVFSKAEMTCKETSFCIKILSYIQNSWFLSLVLKYVVCYAVLQYFSMCFFWLFDRKTLFPNTIYIGSNSYYYR